MHNTLHQRANWNRNPLFNIPGVSIETIMADLLHVVHLGVANVFCMHVIWELLQGNLYGLNCCEAASHSIAVSRLRYVLSAHYKSLAPEVRRHTTEVADFTEGMLGTKKIRTLSTKGAETKGLVPWCCSLLRRFGHTIPRVRDYLLDAGDSLWKFFEIVQTNTRAFSGDACQDWFVIKPSLTQ